MISPIHQLVHTLTFGDAISGEVFALQRCLRSMGRASEIFAINVDPRFKSAAFDYREIPSGFDGEVVLHYSLGSPLNSLYASLHGARRSLIHHNLTPAHWFESVNPRIASDIERGISELPELCRISDRLLADSRFNAGEISGAGREVEVLELPIDPDKWNIEPNSGIQTLLSADPALHLLHVGRLAPNKCIEDIIKVFYFLNHELKVPSRLWLIGHDIDTELYSFGLKRLACELDIADDVMFVGRRADSEVKAFYQNAAVYLCMSEHEGFCCPLIEAMHFGVPVIAYASSAIPDTLGRAGILVKEKRFPEIAELVRRVASDAQFRAGLAQAGRERAAELSYERFESRVREIFAHAGKAELRAAGDPH